MTACLPVIPCHVAVKRRMTLRYKIMLMCRKRRIRSVCKGPVSYYLIDWLVLFGMGTIMWHQAAKACSLSVDHRLIKQLLLRVYCFVPVLHAQRSRRNLTHEGRDCECLPVKTKIVAGLLIC